MEIKPNEPNWHKDTNTTQDYSISLFFSSRNRPDFVDETLTRAYSKAVNPKQIQSIVRFDDDDPKLLSNIKAVSKWNGLSLIGPRLYGYDSLHTYYDECCRLALSDIFWQLNDDAWIVTEGWDRILLEELSKFSKRVFTCSFDVLNIDGKGHAYAWAFPIMSRCMYNLLGKFCYGDVKYIDTLLRFVAEELGTETKLPIQVIHQHIWDQTPDETSANGCLAEYKWVASPESTGFHQMKKRLAGEMAKIFKPYLIGG